MHQLVVGHRYTLTVSPRDSKGICKLETRRPVLQQKGGLSQEVVQLLDLRGAVIQCRTQLPAAVITPDIVEELRLSTSDTFHGPSPSSSN